MKLMRDCRGFTLIEVLVTLSIAMLLTGGGIAAFIRFNDRQSVQTAARQLQTVLRSAQVKARAGETPSGCDRLTGYRVQTTASNSQVVLSAVCTNGVITHTVSNLPNNVISEGSYAITFANLYGGVTGTTTVTLRTAGAAVNRYSFLVTAGGEISDGAFVP